MKHQITLAEAVDMTTRYRTNPVADLANAETFEKASVLKLLEQSGTERFRIYLGRKADNTIHSILVAVDADGRDILPSENEEKSTPGDPDEGIILEDAFRCPPVCSPDSPLNG